MIKSKKQMYIVVGALIFMLMLFSSTYAFFNYTRTGSTNRIKTGRIAFNSVQGTAMNLTNMFPIDVSGGIPNDATKVGTVTIHVTGDTTYTDGLEYLVTAVNVQNTVGNKTVPISIDVGVSSNTNNTPATTLGSADADYFSHRGPSASTSIYKVLAGSTISTDDKLLVGYIKSGSTGVDGNIVIRAYLDADKIAITDTYDGTGTGTNGTTTEWIDDRTVFTTEEWNALQANGVSFQIKVESNEGIWVPGPTAAEVIGALPELEEIAGAKRYVGEDPNNYVIFNNEQWRIVGVYGNQLKIIKSTPIEETKKWNLTDNVTWEGSNAYTILEDTYYPTLSSLSKEMIDDNGIWNIGAASEENNASEAYTGATSVNPWIGKIGLLASYEYLYAAENDGTCWSKNGSDYEQGCSIKDWLWGVLTGSKYHNGWFITPLSGSTNRILRIREAYGSIGKDYVDEKNYLSPVVYLKSKVTITDGTGESGGNEYTLGYTTN